MAEPAAPGRVLGGRYRLVEPLARGGMATVWIAEDTLLARRVAVKTVHPELAVDEGLRERFRAEAISAASVSHPGIVATYDTGDDGGVAYIVMELVDGPTVRQLLDERHRLPAVDAVRIARGVALALDQAHRGGIVHRDIKPANVLVPDDAPVKVTDFGIAKAESASDLTGTGRIIGTARYLAPEQVRGERAEPRSDVYAVGLLLHEMLAGTVPFHGDTEMACALARLSVPPDPLPDDVPPGLAAIVQRCLALDPADRYPNAHALADALDAVIESDDLPLTLPPPPPAARPAAPPPPPPRTGTTGTQAATVVAAAAPATATSPVPARSARPARRKRTPAWPFALLGASLLVIGAVGGYLLVGGHSLDDLLGRSSSSADGTQDQAAAPRIVSVADFDPEGDGSEHGEEVANAVDGDPGTAWRTETYRSTDLGGKPGVGIVLNLAEGADVSSVVVDTGEEGWSGQIYVAATPGAALADWGSPAAEGDGLGASTTFTLDPARSGTAVLLWITHLPEGGRLSVREVGVA